MTQLATVARDGSFRCIYYDYTMCDVLRWPKQAGEERLEASLRRRCRYQRCRTLRVTGWVGRVDGGRIKVPFAIQSDGLGVGSAMGSCSRGAGSALAAGVAGAGGDNDDLKLSSRQGGDRATLLAACLGKAQGPSSDCTGGRGQRAERIASQAILGHKLAAVQMFGARRQSNGISHEGSAAVRVNVVIASTAQQKARRTVRAQRRTSALVICSPWAASEGRAPRITVLSSADSQSIV